MHGTRGRQSWEQHFFLGANGGKISRRASERNLDVDVCVIGAGIAGMTTAYMLTREGRSVAVIDDGPVGGGMTGRTTAHLVNALDDRFYELESMLGGEAARIAAESHTEAINRVDHIVRDESIDCEFERLDGYLVLPDGADTKTIDKEYEATLRALEIQRIEAVPIIRKVSGPALRAGKFLPAVASLT